MSNCLTHWGSMVNQSRLGVVWFEMDSVNMKMRESLGEKHRHFNPFHLCSRIDPSHAQFLKQIQSRTIFLEERFQLTVAAHARASVGMVWFCQKPRAKGLQVPEGLDDYIEEASGKNRNGERIDRTGYVKLQFGGTLQESVTRLARQSPHLLMEFPGFPMVIFDYQSV